MILNERVNFVFAIGHRRQSHFRSVSVIIRRDSSSRWRMERNSEMNLYGSVDGYSIAKTVVIMIPSLSYILTLAVAVIGNR